MLCRACRQARRSAANGPPASPRGHEHTAVLLLRVWHEDDQLRCRLVPGTDASIPPAGTRVAQGVEAICDEVRRWLLQQ